MSICTEIQEHAARSRLFVSPDKIAKLKGKIPKGKRAREMIKVGQGGTLDPLADGVLGKCALRCLTHVIALTFVAVVGLGKGTKHLTKFLDCEKVYIHNASSINSWNEL